MSFLEFSQKAENTNKLKGFSDLAKPDYYTLTAHIVFEGYQPNWLSKGAIRSQFGRVALPSNFADLPNEQRIEIANNLAKTHYAKYSQQIPSAGRISHYYLLKNGKILEPAVFNPKNRA